MRRLIGPLAALSLLLALAAPVAAAGPSLRYTYSSPDHLVVTLVGKPADRVFRVDLSGVGTLSDRTLRFEISPTDLAWNSRAYVIETGGAHSFVVGTIDLRPFVGNPTAAVGFGDWALGADLDSSTIRAPRNGNATLRLIFNVKPGTHYRLSGFTRSAREPFIYGPWIGTGSVSL